MNGRVSDSTVIRHRQEIIRYCFSNELLTFIQLAPKSQTQVTATAEFSEHG